MRNIMAQVMGKTSSWKCTNNILYILYCRIFHILWSLKEGYKQDHHCIIARRWLQVDNISWYGRGFGCWTLLGVESTSSILLSLISSNWWKFMQIINSKHAKMCVCLQGRLFHICIFSVSMDLFKDISFSWPLKSSFIFAEVYKT